MICKSASNFKFYTLICLVLKVLCLAIVKNEYFYIRLNDYIMFAVVAPVSIG